MARKQTGPRPLYLSIPDRHSILDALDGLLRADPSTRADVKRLEAMIASPPRKGHHLVPCEGEAHGNPYIDYCGTCAPRWGWIEVPDATEEG